MRTSWTEFAVAVVHRFGRNQHQSLVRKLYRLKQIGTVENYIMQFSELMDQLVAYEPNPDMFRFVDGLKASVHMVFAVQRPMDLDTAYSIAAVQEEVGECEEETSPPSFRRHFSAYSKQSRQF